MWKIKIINLSYLKDEFEIYPQSLKLYIFIPFSFSLSCHALRVFLLIDRYIHSTSAATPSHLILLPRLHNLYALVKQYSHWILKEHILDCIHVKIWFFMRQHHYTYKWGGRGWFSENSIKTRLLAANRR